MKRTMVGPGKEVPIDNQVSTGDTFTSDALGRFTVHSDSNPCASSESFVPDDFGGGRCEPKSPDPPCP